MTVTPLDLPVSVWKNIAVHLDAADAAALLLVSKTMREHLGDNEFWYDIVCRNWVNMLCDYGIAFAEDIRNKNDMNLSLYGVAVEFLNLDLQLGRFVTNFNPRGYSYSLELALDTFTDDVRFIPVLYQRLVRIKRDCFFSIGMAEANEYIPAIGLLESMLISQNYRLAIDYFADMDQTLLNSTEPDDFEQLWFMLSHFDKSFHHLVHWRAKFYKRAQTVLHQVFFDALSDDVYLLPEDKVISFGSADSFNGFMEDLVIAILKKCIPYNWAEWGELSKVYYEDLSIIRVYSGNNLGDPGVIQTIVMKLLTTFFAGHQVRVGLQEPHEFRPRASASIAHIGPNFYVHLGQRQVHSDTHGEVAFGTLSDVTHFLFHRSSSGRFQATHLSDHLESFVTMMSGTSFFDSFQNFGPIHEALGAAPDTLVHGRVSARTMERIRSIVRALLPDFQTKAIFRPLLLAHLLWEDIPGELFVNSIIKSKAKDLLLPELYSNQRWTIFEKPPPSKSSRISLHVVSAYRPLPKFQEESADDQEHFEPWDADLDYLSPYPNLTEIYTRGDPKDPYRVGTLVAGHRFHEPGMVVKVHGDANVSVFRQLGANYISRKTVAPYPEEAQISNLRGFLKLADITLLSIVYFEVFQRL